MRAPRSLRVACGILGRAMWMAGGRPRGLRILTLHDVPAEHDDRLGRLLDMIARRACFIGPDELSSAVSRASDEPAVLVTFDDGFASHLRLAESILAPRRIRGLFFIPSGFLDAENLEAQRRFAADRLALSPGRPELLPRTVLPMSWDEVRRLHAAGHGVGAHTRSHPWLSSLADPAQIESEIGDGVARLEEILGTRVEHFALPFGDTSAAALEVARRKFRWVYTGMRGSNDAQTPSWGLARDAVSLAEPRGFHEFALLGGLDGRYARARARFERL